MGVICLNFSIQFTTNRISQELKQFDLSPHHWRIPQAIPQGLAKSQASQSGVFARPRGREVGVSNLSSAMAESVGDSLSMDVDMENAGAPEVAPAVDPQDPHQERKLQSTKAVAGQSVGVMEYDGPMSHEQSQTH